ncbi:hypothetical protein [Aquimarina latercula]|uniref:hypothetical protein n=1 Tax=Aquimarina latercula TaxID=987 RepID=UPI0012DE9894|nr:hypothetical protein [Aquimarina latercula]
MKKISQYIILGIIVLFGVFYLYTKFSAAEKGDLAPDFETTLIDGTPLNYQIYKENMYCWIFGVLGAVPVLKKVLNWSQSIKNMITNLL